jgi:predicted nucleic acid-binding Zn ribbon protein
MRICELADCNKELKPTQGKFCSRRCNALNNARHYIDKKIENARRRCENCGIPTKNPKYCSKRCGAVVNNAERTQRRRQQPKEVVVCVVCGKSFERQPKQRDKKTCSDPCTNKCRGCRGLKYTPETLFVCDKNISRGTVKRWGLAWGYLELKCGNCGITEWLGKPAPIQLDHINGIGWDHRIENIRMLCGNCHGQTETYAGKNITYQRSLLPVALIPTEPLTKACTGCGKQIGKKSPTGLCTTCFNRTIVHKSKRDWPSTDVLIQMVKDKNYLQVGKALGVSDNAVRKRIREHPDS